MKDYNKKYKETHRYERKEYRRTKKETDENYKIEQSLRSRFHKFLKVNKGDYDYCELFGCDRIDFNNWLESNFTNEMSWENYGSSWNIDHIIPVSIFDLSKTDEQNFCFNWKNTRPLKPSVNFSRKCSLFDILIQEMKTKFFAKDDGNYNDINYGVSYLPISTRNRLMDLVNP